jgi:cytochrome oxidase assembly protein ShyY1
VGPGGAFAIGGPDPLWLHSGLVDRSLLRGRYLVGHVVVVVLAGLFVTAGFWQLDRLHQVRASNAVVRSRMASPPVPIDRVLQPDAAAPGAASYRRVTVSGRYDQSRQVLIEFRSYSGNPGDYLMTPLVTPSGSAILVNRGWIPLSNTPLQQVRGLQPLTGQVRVTGILFPSEKSGPAPKDAAAGIVETTRIDLARLERRFDSVLYPAYLQLTSQDPRQAGTYPVVLPVPQLSEGPHLSYAIQWFMFTAIGLIGWPIVLRRSRRDRTGSPDRTLSDRA